MPQRIERLIVRICDHQGNTVGAGFVVRDRLILTCAHVLESAGFEPGDCVEVVFHISGEHRQTRILAGAWYPSDKEDLALLSIDGDLPAGVEVAVLGLPSGSGEQAFKTLGYPYGGPGVLAEGKFQVRPLDGIYPEFPQLQLQSNQVTKGFSGAPILSTVTDCVVGMVVALLPQDQFGRGSETAYGISAGLILDKYPGLQVTQPGMESHQAVENLCDQLKSARYAFEIYRNLSREDEQFHQYCQQWEGKLVDLRRRLVAEGVEEQDCARMMPDDSSDPRFKRAAIRCGVPRWWDARTLTRLAPFDEKDEWDKAEHLYGWLSMTPFAVKYRDCGFSYCPDVRSGLQRFIRRRDGIDWRNLHQELAAFWEQRQILLGEPQSSYDTAEIWEYRLNVLYHKLCRTAQLSPVLTEVCQQLLGVDAEPERCTYRLKRLAEIIDDANSYRPDSVTERWIERIRNVANVLENCLRDEEENILIDHMILLEKFWEPLVQEDIFSSLSDPQLRRWIWVCIGDLRLERGDNLDTLLDTYHRAGDDFAPARIGQGKAYLKWGRYREAIPCFDRAIEMEGSSFEALAFRGRAYHLCEQWQHALEDFERALRFQSNTGWIYLELAQVRQHLEDYEGAQREFQKAIEQGLAASDEFVAHFGLAEVSERLGDYETAVEEWSILIERKERAEEQDEELVELYIRRANAFSQVGDKNMAALDRERAEELMRSAI